MWRSRSNALGHRLPLPVAPSLPASSEPAPMRVPDVVGLSLMDARLLARHAGQRVFTVERDASPGLRGCVLEQQPSAGSEPADDAILVLTVGARPHVTVPDVRGRAEDDALSMLREAGLGTARRATRRSDVVPEGSIVRTRPRAGAEVPAGSLVSYVVASGTHPSARSRRPGRRRVRAMRLPDGSFLRL